MEYCSKCGKKLPKIFGIYIDNCYKDDGNVFCETCYHKRLSEIAENSKKIMKLRESIPNNGCNQCGSKNATIFNDEKALWFCEKCFYIAKYGEVNGLALLNRLEEIRNIKTFGKINIYIKEREFEIIPIYRRYKVDDVISYELIENGHVETKGGIGGAILGNAIAGVPGAIIGYTHGKKHKNMCSEYRIFIRMKGGHPINIGYIGGGVNVAYDTAEFLGYKQDAHNTIAGIEYILEMSNKEKDNQEISNNSKSFAEEIIKLKNLLDEGIITKDEFEKAKERLLNE